MRKVGVILFALIAVNNVGAQSTTQWQQIYGGPGVEVGYSVKTCLGQGYVVAGSSSSNGPTDGHVIRTDSLGLVMWEKFYGGVNIDIIRSIKLLPDSGFVCAGYSNSGGMGGYDGWILRLDKNGDTLWTKYFGTTNWDFFYDVATTYDSGFVLAGGTYGLGNGDEDMWFVKLDSVGNFVWERTWGGVKQDEARGVIETEDSLLVGCGFNCSLGDTLGDSWILRMNSVDGDTMWTRKGTHTIGADLALAVASDNGQQRFCVVGQYTTATGDLNAFAHVMMLDSNTQIDLTAGISGYEYYSSVVFWKSSYNFAAFGATQNDGAGNGDYFMFTTVTYLAYTYGTIDFETGYGIDTAARKGYIACGISEGFGSTSGNTYLVKIDSTGFSSTVLAVRNRPILYASSSVYPNPAREQATITLDITNPLDGQATLSVYDQLGRVVYESGNGAFLNQSNTTSTCIINTFQISNGVYTYTVRDNTSVIANGQLIISH